MPECGLAFGSKRFVSTITVTLCFQDCWHLVRSEKKTTQDSQNPWPTLGVYGVGNQSGQFRHALITDGANGNPAHIPRNRNARNPVRFHVEEMRLMNCVQS